MNIKYGNLWDSTDPVILVTTNSYVNVKGELVMGRGAALELKEKFSFLARYFGDRIKEFDQEYESDTYGVFLYEHNKLVWNNIPRTFGIFQVKYHFRNPADLELIKHSTKLAIDLFPDNIKVSMNFPGIGYGQLDYFSVYDIIKILPENFTLYMKKDS
jgi:hypothetical protein